MGSALFDGYADETLSLLALARVLAYEHGSRTIESEHLLLALTRDAGAVLARVWTDLDVKPAEIRRHVERSLPDGETVPTLDIPLGDTARATLALGEGEARALGDRLVGPEHVLLGLAAAVPDLAHDALAEAGVAYLSLRSAVVRLHRQS